MKKFLHFILVILLVIIILGAVIDAYAAPTPIWFVHFPIILD
jgi:hypothetical protein